MAPHQQRVVAEYEELTERVEKLGAFITSNPAYHNVDRDEQVRLSSQFGAMSAYLFILGERIKAFTS